jgi:peptidoglycan hydrolase-like protein with peptidoglycan-binding domain
MNIKTKIVTALTLAALVVPGISLAQTMSVAQLQAEIQSLTAQLTQLQAQLAAAGGTTTTWCYTFNNNLSIGMSGNAVTELQTALQKDGESVTITGTFDDQTASAVTAFQEKYQSQILSPYGLSYGTGYAGKSTRAELNSLFGCTGSNPVTPPIVVNPITPTSTPTSTSSSSSPSVNLQINGSNGSLTVSSGATLNLVWSSIDIPLICSVSYPTSAGPSGNMTEATSGSLTLKAMTVSTPSTYTYGVACPTSGAEGSTVSDTVQVNVAPTISTTPSTLITVQSPSSGQTFTQGASNAITWTGGAQIVIINLYNSTGQVLQGMIPVTNAVTNTGSYTWDGKTIYTESGSGETSSAIAQGSYRIKVLDAQGDASMSNVFSVVAPATISTSTTVTVTIQNPSAGQTFTQGASNIVAWTGTQSAASLMLYDASGQTFEGTISPSLVSSALTGSGNSYSWNAQALYGSSGSASTIAPGSYRLKVTDNRGDFAMSNVFTVVAPAAISTSTTVTVTTPTITNVAPNQGTLGTSITISGINLSSPSEIAFCNAQNQCNGFMNGNNATVSSDGTSLVFSIPGVFFPSSVVGGTTQIHVVTPAGNSNSWPFQVLPAN